MLDKLESEIGIYRNALELRDQRQQILAANIAHSDTPHYQARDIDFHAELAKATNQNGAANSIAMKVTSSGHIHENNLALSSQSILYRVPYQASADGNTVEMDQERMQFIDNSVRFQSSLRFLGEQFKNLMSVLQQGA